MGHTYVLRDGRSETSTRCNKYGGNVKSTRMTRYNSNVLLLVSGLQTGHGMASHGPMVRWRARAIYAFKAVGLPTKT